METTIATQKNFKRIDSLDVLRAFVLLGILIVHCDNGFGFLDPAPITKSTERLHMMIHVFLASKCNIAFTTLFGASFGLILRNKNNTSLQFFWRCIILIGFGLINKLFYWYDALMLFGVTGIMMIPFRYMRTGTILVLTISVYFIIPLVWPFVHIDSLLFNNWVPGISPDISKTTLSDVLHRPLWEGIATYTYEVTITGGVFRRFMFMALGYLLVRNNIVYHIADYLKGRYLALLWGITMVTIYFQFFKQLPSFISIYKNIANPIACYTYCYTILYIYYRYKPISRFMLKLAPYGRMSLTNYTMQSIICVCIFTYVGKTTSSFTPLAFITYIVCFFGFQLLFSYYWMKYMTYGPMEWVWRILTKLKYVPLLRRKTDE